MAGQAGWYRAPGEEGLLRYWNGTAWTAHRQPMPVVTPVEDPDPMAEYERQFASSDDEVTGSALVPVRQASLVSAGASGYTAAPAPLLSSQPGTGESPAVETAPVEPTAVVPAVEPAPVEPTAVLPTTVERIGEELVGAAFVADGIVGFGPGRKGLLTALKGMGTGISIVILGIAILVFLGSNSAPAAGEVTGSGIVTSLGATTGNSCTPVARFAVAGRSYTAQSRAGISPCPVGLGQSVNIVYSAANPASDARVQIGTSVTHFAWLIPVLGAILFLGSLFTFVVRAGSIAAGVALVRDGRRRTSPFGETAGETTD
jgi:hypothetical protein